MSAQRVVDAWIVGALGVVVLCHAALLVAEGFRRIEPCLVEGFGVQAAARRKGIPHGPNCAHAGDRVRPNIVRHM